MTRSSLLNIWNIFPLTNQRMRNHLVLVKLTNQQQFSMVCTFTGQKYDVKILKKPKWNHQPQASGFTEKSSFQLACESIRIFWLKFLVSSAG